MRQQILKVAATISAPLYKGGFEGGNVNLTLKAKNPELSYQLSFEQCTLNHQCRGMVYYGANVWLEGNGNVCGRGESQGALNQGI